MTEPCLGTDYYPAGIFCKACPDRTACEEAIRARHNIPDSQNTSVGKPMFEAHVQETPAIIFPNGGAEFTPEVAASLIKKKARAGIPREEEGHKRGPYGKLGIPYEAGTAAYARAYYWCKKLGKTYPEVQKIRSNPPEKLTSDTKKTEPVKDTATNKGGPLQGEPALDVLHASDKKTAGGKAAGGIQEDQIAELVKLLREISTLSSTISGNIAAMNGNLLSIRKEMQDLRSDVKRYSGSKGH